MHIYQAKQQIAIPENINLTELLHTNSSNAVPTSHVIAADSLENREITIGELQDTAGRLAHGLKSAFHPRDQSRWAIVLPNGIAFIEAVHAVLWLDGVFCPINLDLQPAEIGHALLVSKVDYAIVHHETVPKVLKAFKAARETDQNFKVPKMVVALGSVKGHQSLHADFLSNKRLAIPRHANTKDRLASIHLSSGTTGKPKGVGLSHYNYVANVYQCQAHDPAHWNSSHSSLVFSPMVHIANTTLPLFLGPWVGMKHVILARFDVDSFCKMVEKHKPIDMMLARPIIPRLLTGELQKKYDFSSVKYLVGTGGRRQEVTDALLAAGGWTEFIDLYGMTEAAPYIAWSRIGDKVPALEIGSFVPNVEARLCDNDGKDVPIGKSGELWLRGPSMTTGYVENPAANASAFKDDGTWYNTGDVCTISADGNLAIVGRTKELFKSSGFQVSPQELEAYLLSHPDIEEAAVGPTYDKEKKTDVATAYVVLKESVKGKDAKLKALQSIVESLDGKVSGYKKLKGGAFEVLRLPKNGTGKVMRNMVGDHKTGLLYIPDVGLRNKL